jgi:hypothetical protein
MAVRDLPGRRGARERVRPTRAAPGPPTRATIRRASVFWPIVRRTSGGGPTNVRPAFRHASAKAPVLGQESVSGMDGIGPGLAGGAHHPLDREVALARRRGPDRHRLISRPDVERSGVRVRVHGDRADPELPAGADDRSAISPRLATSTVPNRIRPPRGEMRGREPRRDGPRRGPPLPRGFARGPPASAAHRACTTSVVGPTNLVLKTWWAPIRAWATSSNPRKG